MNPIRELVYDQTGSATAEYAMLVALIVVGIAGAISLFSDQIDSIFGEATSGLSEAK